MESQAQIHAGSKLAGCTSQELPLLGGRNTSELERVPFVLTSMDIFDWPIPPSAVDQCVREDTSRKGLALRTGALQPFHTFRCDQLGCNFRLP
jgi:hypothetical protein